MATRVRATQQSETRSAFNGSLVNHWRLTVSIDNKRRLYDASITHTHVPHASIYCQSELTSLELDAVPAPGLLPAIAVSGG